LVEEALMSNLLSRLRLVRHQKQVPVYMEFAVNPDTAPYLVTSSKGLVWVEASMDPEPDLWPREKPEHIVRVAVRPDVSPGPSGFYREVVEAVLARGQKSDWGNVLDYTEEGVEAAIEHVAHYEFGDLCLLYPPSSRMETPLDDAELPLPLKEIALRHELLPQPCSWMPDYSAAVVPKEREFLGAIGFHGRKGVVVLVHNAARGMALAVRRDGA
jgi:hypothetical protein